MLISYLLQDNRKFAKMRTRISRRIYKGNKFIRAVCATDLLFAFAFSACLFIFEDDWIEFVRKYYGDKSWIKSLGAILPTACAVFYIYAICVRSWLLNSAIYDKNKNVTFGDFSIEISDDLKGQFIFVSERDTLIYDAEFCEVVMERDFLVILLEGSLFIAVPNEAFKEISKEEFAAKLNKTISEAKSEI